MDTKPRLVSDWAFLKGRDFCCFFSVVSGATLGTASSNQIKISQADVPAFLFQIIRQGSSWGIKGFRDEGIVALDRSGVAKIGTYEIAICSEDKMIEFWNKIFRDLIDQLILKFGSSSKVIDEFRKLFIGILPIPRLVEAFANEHINELMCDSPVEMLAMQSGVTDVLVQGFDQIWVEQNGALKKSPLVFKSDSTYRVYIENLLAKAGRFLDINVPFVDFSLIDGSRGHIIGPPATLGQIYLSIRKARPIHWSLEELLSFEMYSREVFEFLRNSVLQRKNILVAGATGSGKTTLLKSLFSEIPVLERVVVIEDSIEFVQTRENTAYLYTRTDSRGEMRPITLRDLVKQALRMRPDRIIIGETRGEEAMDLLHAMNTGHRGCFTSIHANSCRDALVRLQGLVRMSSSSLSEDLVRHWISKNIQTVVFCSRGTQGERKVSEIVEIKGVEGAQLSLEQIQ